MPSKLTNEIATERINKRCAETNITFLGFDNSENSYDGKYTNLRLKCNKCGKEWNSTKYDYFVTQKRKIHTCSRTYDKKKLERKLLEKVKNLINADHFDFIGLSNEFKTTDSTFLRIKCKKCQNTFDYSYPQLLINKGIKKCKICEYGSKLKVEVVLKNILEKCLRMDYTFLGFDNDENTYKNSSTRLVLKCNKCGRVWSSTTYDRFIRKTLTCDGCNKVWKMEKELELLFEDYGEKFEQQKTFDWLKFKNNMFLDFYLPQYNIAIECQGKEHFEPTKAFGGENTFKKISERDAVKFDLCSKHGVKILYYSDLKEYNTFLGEKLVKDKNILLETIKSYGQKN